METILLLLGLIVGFAIGYILYIKNKTQNVSRAEFDFVTNKSNELLMSLKLSEERLSANQETLQSLQNLLSEKEKNIGLLYNELNSVKELLAESRASEAASQKRLNEYQIESEEKERIIKELNLKNETQVSEISELGANNKFLKEKLETHKDEIAELQRNAQLTFEKIANEILE